VNGQILNLDKEYLPQLQKIVVSKSDSTNMYVNDGNSNELFYYVLLPRGSVKGVLVLLAGTWDTAEYVLSNNKALAQLAFENDIAVITPSINQRLTLNSEVVDFLNNVFKDAITKFRLPKEKFVLGGFSMGGLFSLRYTEMAHENNAQTSIVPIAVYSVDGPTDLNTYIHRISKSNRKKS
jgi:alpha-beta hydrolase superfamily lysophospholipase